MHRDPFVCTFHNEQRSLGLYILQYVEFSQFVHFKMHTLGFVYFTMCGDLSVSTFHNVQRTLSFYISQCILLVCVFHNV